MNQDGSSRRSLGGRVVEDSLVRAGYDLLSSEGLALVETAQPTRRSFDIVLAQNAWNVVPVSDLRRRLSDYPSRMWGRFLARRALAALNLRRATRVICLTQAMADMCSSFSRRVEVSAVTVPMDILDPMDDVPALEPGTLLVPGTVTWFKNPAAALDLFERDGGTNWTRVLFAGGDDGSGCWEFIAATAASRGLPCRRERLDRAEMRMACKTADAVVVPSRLESLSFSMAEALVLSRRVFASQIKAHVEVAERLGREPVWLDALTQVESVDDPGPARSPKESLLNEWDSLGVSLGLRRTSVGSDRDRWSGGTSG